MRELLQNGVRDLSRIKRHLCLELQWSKVKIQLVATLFTCLWCISKFPFNQIDQNLLHDWTKKGVWGREQSVLASDALASPQQTEKWGFQKCTVSCLQALKIVFVKACLTFNCWLRLRPCRLLPPFSHLFMFDQPNVYVYREAFMKF